MVLLIGIIIIIIIIISSLINYYFLGILLLLGIVLGDHHLDHHGNLPMIQLLGAQKAGSSSLFEFLIEHPKVSSS